MMPVFDVVDRDYYQRTLRPTSRWTQLEDPFVDNLSQLLGELKLQASLHINVRLFGAKGDGVANDSAAITQACISNRTVAFPAGVYRIGSDVVIPSTCTVVMARGASFSVDYTKTLTARGRIDADKDAFIFQGQGQVKGLTYTTPNQFGAVADCSDDASTGTDCSPAINKALAALTGKSVGVDRFAGKNFARPKLEFLAGQMKLAAQCTTVVDAINPLELIGAGRSIGGTRLLVTHNNPAIYFTTNTINGVLVPVDFRMDGFFVQKIGTRTGTVGVQLGDSFSVFNNFWRNSIENCSFYNFGTNVMCVNTNGVTLKNCHLYQDADNAINFHMHATAGKTCGDVTLDSCIIEFPLAGQSTAFNVLMEADAGCADCRGLSLINTYLYRGSQSIYIKAGVGTNVGDIELVNTGSDGVTTAGYIYNNHFRLEAASGATIDGVKISNGYFAGAYSFMQTAGAGTVKGVYINNTHAWYLQGFGIQINTLWKNWSITDCNFKEIGTSITEVDGAIRVDGVGRGLSVKGCSLDNPTTSAQCKHLIFLNAAITDFSESGNSCAGAGWVTKDVWKSTVIVNGQGTAGYGFFDGSRGFWRDDTTGANINRVFDRLLVGAATKQSGNYSLLSNSAPWNQDRSWVGFAAGGKMAYFDGLSTFHSSSQIGGVAIAASTRASDQTGKQNDALGAYNTAIGLASYALGDKAGRSAWGGYVHAVRAINTSGPVLCLEMDIAQKQNTTTLLNPFLPSASDMAGGLFLSAGGETAYAETVYPSSVALVISGNGSTHNGGIIFQANAITGTDGITGYGAAIKMANRQSIEIWGANADYSGRTLTTAIYSTAGTAFSGYLAFIAQGFQWQDSNNNSALQVTSAPGNANGLWLQGSISGSPVKIEAYGNDGNIDLSLVTKGTGNLRLPKNAAAATTPASFSATRVVQIKQNDGTVLYVPAMLAAW
jgi:hypothetical protein